MRSYEKCVIFAGAPLPDGLSLPSDFLMDAYLIACDSGYQNAQMLGVKPHLVLGDFDSYSGSIEPGIPVICVASEKDDTDTMLAIKQGLECGCTEFLLIGGTGGRFDHTFANIQGLVHIAKNGGRGILFDAENQMTVIDSSALVIPRTQGYTLSVFALSDCAKGVTLRGVKYPLTNALLTTDFPLGVSNEIVEDCACVSVEAGILLIVTSKCTSFPE